MGDGKCVNNFRYPCSVDVRKMICIAQAGSLTIMNYENEKLNICTNANTHASSTHTLSLSLSTLCTLCTMYMYYVNSNFIYWRRKCTSTILTVSHTQYYSLVKFLFTSFLLSLFVRSHSRNANFSLSSAHRRKCTFVFRVRFSSLLFLAVLFYSILYSILSSDVSLAEINASIQYNTFRMS